MAKYSNAFNLALGALWTAGHRPTLKEKSALLSLTGYGDRYRPYDDTQNRALEALTKLGYRLTDVPSEYDLVEKVADIVPQDGPPTAGHSVLLSDTPAAKRLSILNPNILFTLQGEIGQQKTGFALARTNQGWTCSFSSWREDTDRRFVSLSCGGPSTIGSYATERFVKTDRNVRHQVWDFAFTPEAHTACYFETTSPIWLWDGAESDNLSSRASDWTSLAA